MDIRPFLLMEYKHRVLIRITLVGVVLSGREGKLLLLILLMCLLIGFVHDGVYLLFRTIFSLLLHFWVLQLALVFCRMCDLFFLFHLYNLRIIVGIVFLLPLGLLSLLFSVFQLFGILIDKFVLIH